MPDAAHQWQAGYTAVTLSLLIIEQLANLLAAVGALLMVLRRKASLLTRQIGLAALAATFLLIVIRFSGTLAAAYGQERAQLQALVLLGVAMCWTFQALTGLRRQWQARIRVLASGCLAVVFVNTVYLVGAVLGGATSVNLTNSGPVFEYFYVTAPEIASAHWLGSQFRSGDLVYADEYGQVPLAAGTKISERPDDRPDPADAQRRTRGSTPARPMSSTTGRSRCTTSTWPRTCSRPAFLDANYDMVYTNGTSEVFHR